MNFIRNRNFRAGPQTSLEGFICPQNSDKQQKIKVFGRSEGGKEGRKEGEGKRMGKKEEKERENEGERKGKMKEKGRRKGGLGEETSDGIAWNGGERGD